MIDADKAEAVLEREYPLVSPYSNYAALYDELGQSNFGLAMLQLIERAIQRHPLAGARVLDLACGTGTVASQLAKRGYQVTGVDRSGEMLEIAAAKAREAGVEVELQQQNMASLRMARRFDLVICLYDSLNYLLSDGDLEAAFAGVARVLDVGGLFIFDFNTLHCLANDWGNQVVEERAAAAALMHLYSFSPESRIGTLELFCVSKRPDGLVKFREIHRERGYTAEEIRNTLRGSGLVLLEEMAFPDLAEPNDEASRLICVATKPAEAISLSQ